MILERHADSSTQLTYVKPPTGRQIVNSNEESNVGFNVLMLIHIFVQFTLVRVSSPKGTSSRAPSHRSRLHRRRASVACGRPKFGAPETRPRRTL